MVIGSHYEESSPYETSHGPGITVIRLHYDEYSPCPCATYCRILLHDTRRILVTKYGFSPEEVRLSQCYSKDSSLAQKITEAIKMIFDPTEHTSRAQGNKILQHMRLFPMNALTRFYAQT